MKKIDASTFIELPTERCLSNRHVRHARVAVMDFPNMRSGRYPAGGDLELVYELELAEDLEGAPVLGWELRDSSGCVVHGSNTLLLQNAEAQKKRHGVAKLVHRVKKAGAKVAAASAKLRAGAVLRAHHRIQLNLTPGKYILSVYFATQYTEPTPGALLASLREHSRLVDVATVQVVKPTKFDPAFYGLVNLPTHTQFDASAKRADLAKEAADKKMLETEFPTLVQVTHYKAGSQWIRMVLNDCFSDRVVKPEWDLAHFLRWPIQPGRVYLCVYVNKPQFDQVLLPPGTKHFVVIRDLRDTLVSGYFSALHSHKPRADSVIPGLRSNLSSLSKEDGLLEMLNSWLPLNADIQQTWVSSKQPFLRYEDLLSDDINQLKKVLIDELKIPVPPERLEQSIIANRFEARSGRERGVEDLSAHRRKGVAGDWSNHFTPKLTEAFKVKFGPLLIETGYENDLNW